MEHFTQVGRHEQSLHSSLKGRQQGPGGARLRPGRWKSTQGTEGKNNTEQGYIKQSKSDHIPNISKATPVQIKLCVLVLLTKFGQMSASYGELPPPSLSHSLARGHRRNHAVLVSPSHSHSLGAHLTASVFMSVSAPFKVIWWSLRTNVTPTL